MTYLTLSHFARWMNEIVEQVGREGVKVKENFKMFLTNNMKIIE